VVVAATYGWYWLVDLLTDLGAGVHLAHPLGLAWGHRRRKDDVTDASDLVDLLRMGRLPEAWIAPPEVRQLRELVRYRARLVELRTGLKNQAHAVLAKEGVAVPVADLFGLAGTRLLKEVELADAYRIRVESLCGLIGEFDREVRTLDGQIHRRLSDETGYRTVQQIPGVGRVIAAIFVAEIGDVDRFPSPRHLCSWAGLTPRHRESDGVVRRGPITKQGSGLLRWAAVEAAQKLRVGSWLKTDFVRIASQRGRPIARVAVARRILSLAYYGLRDSHIRSLATGEVA
jgi:transposase